MRVITKGKKDGSKAFTLIETLAVLLIIVIVMAWAVPALFLGNSSDLTKSVYDFQGALQFARAYAVSHRTYTWLGFFEEDAAKGGQIPAAPGIGRLSISIVASRDGTAVYNRTDAQTFGGKAPVTQNLDSARLVQLSKLIHLENVHIFLPAPGTDLFSQRPGSRIAATDRVGLSPSEAPLIFRFQYPLNGTARYIFGARSSGKASGVIQFNPQGEAISETGPVPGVVPCKEIALQATHGNKAYGSANAVAINIAGLTGQSTIYRR